MKTAIVYKSYLGSTKKYAQLLSQDICGDLYTYKNFDKRNFKKYGRFIILSGTYFGWMPLVKYLEKNWQYLHEKNVIVLAVGMAPDKDPWSVKSYEKIPPRIRESIMYYKLHGNMKLTKAEELYKKYIKKAESSIGLGPTKH